MLKISKDSHVDHGLTEVQIEFLLDLFADKDGFFVQEVTMPSELGSVPCALYGPIMGDEPVSQDEVYYKTRPSREGLTRFVDRPVRYVNVVTIIAGPHNEDTCVLYTAFGGPLAPKEPWNTASDEEEAKSLAFWNDHALCES